MAHYEENPRDGFELIVKAAEAAGCGLKRFFCGILLSIDFRLLGNHRVGDLGNIFGDLAVNKGGWGWIWWGYAERE